MTAKRVHCCCSHILDGDTGNRKLAQSTLKIQEPIKPDLQRRCSEKRRRIRDQVTNVKKRQRQTIAGGEKEQRNQIKWESNN